MASRSILTAGSQQMIDGFWDQNNENKRDLRLLLENSFLVSITIHRFEIVLPGLILAQTAARVENRQDNLFQTSYIGSDNFSNSRSGPVWSLIFCRLGCVACSAPTVVVDFLL